MVNNNGFPNPSFNAINNAQDRLTFSQVWVRYFKSQFDRLTNLESEVNDMAAGSLIGHAKDVIKQSLGDDVSFSSKGKDLLKFGTNPNVGTSRATIWYTGQDHAHESYVAINTNSIDSISSNNASDTEVVVVEGHTDAAGFKTFITQNITLSGQARVALTTPLNRVTGVHHAGQTATDLVGEIYVYQNTAISSGKPTDTTKIHLTLPAGENQSQKASTTLSNTDYWVISSFTVNYLEKSGSNVADFRIEVRSSLGVFRPFTSGVAVSTGTSREETFEPYLIVPPNSDVRITAEASANGQNLSANINGFLAEII